MTTTYKVFYDRNVVNIELQADKDLHNLQQLNFKDLKLRSRDIFHDANIADTTNSRPNFSISLCPFIIMHQGVVTTQSELNQIRLIDCKQNGLVTFNPSQVAIKFCWSLHPIRDQIAIFGRQGYFQNCHKWVKSILFGKRKISQEHCPIGASRPETPKQVKIAKTRTFFVISKNSFYI